MNEYAHLKGLEEDGTPPETRMGDAVETYNLVARLINLDEKRAKTRSTVKGLFDGNPPYRRSDLVRAGQAYRANVNWRIAESFLNMALTAYWDVVTEAPTMATCTTNQGQDGDREDWSRIITEEFQDFNRGDRSLNYMFQTSQYYMTLNGSGPVVWEDDLDYRAKAIHNILIPDGTRADLEEWEVAVVTTEYNASDLYGFIRNGKAAEKAGWNVDAVKDVLIKSFPKSKWPNRIGDRWEWLQNKLRNNDLYYSQVCQRVMIAHVFYREFPTGSETKGKISHCIVETDTKGPQFLFRKLKRFSYWRQVIAPFYYDVGDGTHHSVKGLGIKAFGALESYNRLQCSIVDSAGFGSSMHIQATTENTRQNASVVEMGPYKVWPSQFNIVPNINLGQMLEGPIAVKQDLLNTVTSNVAQYRQGLSRQQGNPITATEAAWRAENETTLARTQLSRYFDQLDEFWEERYRRAVSTKVACENAKTFQKRCIDRGVPRKALDDMKSVRATRTVGYGSAFNRLQALNRMLNMISMLPEDGRRRLLEDLTAAQVGQSLMRRYLPEQPDNFTDDRVVAALQIAAAKHGIKPILPEDVNNEVFAMMFIEAAAQVAGSLQQGANPMEVLRFLETIGPAIAEHIAVIEQDPTKKATAKALKEEFNKIAKLTDQIRKQVEQMAQRQAQAQATAAQAQQINAGVDPETQLKAAESRAKLGMQEEKTRHQMALRQAKANQDMAIKNMEAQQQLTQGSDTEQ